MTTTMCTKTRWVSLLTPLVLMCGCIVGDQLTTLTIYPDGSADLILVRSNLRSTEDGERAKSELATLRRQFSDRTEGELLRIGTAGGEILATSWIREDAPMANVVHASFPDAASLQRYWTVSDEAGNPVVTAEFQRQGSQCRLVFRIQVPADQVAAEPSAPMTVAQQRQAYANGISETRIAVVHGTLTSARGFTVAADKQSALLDVHQLNDLLREGRGHAELRLEWDIAP